MTRKASSEKSDLSYAVIQLRKSFGDTQKAFADRLGLTPIVIARWETTRPPRGKSLELLVSMAEQQDDISQYVFRKYLREERGTQSRFERFANNLKPERQNETRNLIRDLMFHIAKYDRIDIEERVRWLRYLVEIGDRTTDLPDDHFGRWGEMLLGPHLKRYGIITPPGFLDPPLLGFGLNEGGITLSARKQEADISSVSKLGAKKDVKRRKK